MCLTSFAPAPQSCRGARSSAPAIASLMPTLGIEPETVWLIVTVSVPRLRDQLAALLATLD